MELSELLCWYYNLLIKNSEGKYHRGRTVKLPMMIVQYLNMVARTCRHIGFNTGSEGSKTVGLHIATDPAQPDAGDVCIKCTATNMLRSLETTVQMPHCFHLGRTPCHGAYCPD